MLLRKLLILIFFTGGLVLGSNVSAQNNPVVIIPYIYNNGHHIIKVKLNGSNHLNFIFDSGAGATLITEKVADSLELIPDETRKNIGVSGAHKVGVIKNVELKVEEVLKIKVDLLSTKTDFEELDNGSNVHGVIGYPILQNYVVEMDNQNHEIILYDRVSYVHSESGISLPINILYNLPVIEAGLKMYNGKSFIGNFIVDTGARSGVIISSPTVVWYDMADNVGKYYNMRKVIGTSKRKSKVRYGRLASFNLAGHQFNNVPVVLSSDNMGVLADPSFDGLIGNGILERFNVIFDYYLKMIHFVPNESIHNDFAVNNTGFSIVYKEGKPYLEDLVERSPADEAGLKNDDQIVRINGKMSDEIKPEKLRKYFDKAGVNIELEIKRDNELIKVKFITQSLI